MKDNELKELIKNFIKIREYMREFYVYGFKTRNDFKALKSTRTYDDERKRIENWLGDYVDSNNTKAGKSVFLSIDTRVTSHNPLYKAWKSKSFTSSDIFLHFIILDILQNGEEKSLEEVIESVDNYIFGINKEKYISDGTIRAKLKEYVEEGILTVRKDGKAYLYSRSSDNRVPNADVLNFFSEVAPCGVIGSFLLDQSQAENEHFGFKHHYITDSMDSEILYEILNAMNEKRVKKITSKNRKEDSPLEKYVVPLRVMISVQTGRQYMVAYCIDTQQIAPFRIDNIISVGEKKKKAVKEKEIVFPQFDEMRAKLDEIQTHMWGINIDNFSDKELQHVEFTIHYNDTEQYIPQRLEREKRTGTVEYIDSNTCRYSADVFDANELVPWIRTFICRIKDISFSNKHIEQKFKDDMQKMYEMYGLECEDNDIS